jgi:hypothetical protein
MSESYVLLGYKCGVTKFTEVIHDQSDAATYTIVLFLLGDTPAPGFYVPTFRNTL